MKKRLQGFIAGITIGALLTGGTVFAKTGSEYIEAVYNNIKIYVDGVKIDPKDSNGSKVEPFIYNGTTYLPVRAVGEAIGKTVTWDGETQSVYLGEKPGDIQYLMDVCPPYDVIDYNGYWRCDTYSSSETKTFSMAGNKYTNGLVMAGCNSDETYALFNLNGKYSSLKLTIAPLDGNEDPSDIAFFVDGKKVAEYNIEKGDYPKEVKVPLKNGLQLKIVTVDDSGKEYTGLGNIIIE